MSTFHKGLSTFHMEAGAADSAAAPPTGKRAVASNSDMRASVKDSRPQHAAKRKCARVPHGGSKAYFCPKCKKEFESRQSLDYHYTFKLSWMVRPVHQCLAIMHCSRECIFAGGWKVRLCAARTKTVGSAL